MSKVKTIPIVPNGKRYWVLPNKIEKQTRQVGEYEVEETADKKKPPLEGRIVAVGDAMQESLIDLGGGIRTKPVKACKYQLDDLVVFGSYAGNIHTLDGVDYTVLHEDEILGLRIETPFDVRDNTDLTRG